MKIKVCGLTDINQITTLSNLNIDRLGFIFHKISARYIENKLDKTELVLINQNVIRTGVFVNEEESEIEKSIHEYQLNSVQLHGNESPEFCKKMKNKVELIKTISISEANSFNEAEQYNDACNYFLFDTYSDAYGGTGKKFDWNWLNNYKLSIPFFLSGGIDLNDIEKIKEIKHPQFVGIDVNSKFELIPGIKDIDKIIELIKLVKQ